ncbi:hypothetical protein J2S10_003657 [Neobacillus ginsengisoli]|uniref:Uncharacterized protein n=2 Tax=Neobacillus ginsengisoli TaxID=904295 RepID=A0ABT9XY29_9BACI|nr:hypothetical protein [Neobacillus ginsengisoli]
MIRMAVAGVVGFILIFVEAMIVMYFKGYQTIEFGGLVPFINIWAMNFFLVFSFLTQLTNWYENREGFEKGEEDNSF